MSGTVAIVIIIILVVIFIVALGSRKDVVQQRNQAYQQQVRSSASTSNDQLIIRQIIDDVTLSNEHIREMDHNRYNSMKLRQLDSDFGVIQRRINNNVGRLSIQQVHSIYVTWIDGRSVQFMQWQILLVSKYAEFNF